MRFQNPYKFITYLQQAITNPMKVIIHPQFAKKIPPESDNRLQLMAKAFSYFNFWGLSYNQHDSENVVTLREGRRLQNG